MRLSRSLPLALLMCAAALWNPATGLADDEDPLSRSRAVRNVSRLRRAFDTSTEHHFLLQINGAQEEAFPEGLSLEYYKGDRGQGLRLAASDGSTEYGLFLSDGEKLGQRHTGKWTPTMLGAAAVNRYLRGFEDSRRYLAALWELPEPPKSAYATRLHIRLPRSGGEFRLGMSMDAKGWLGPEFARAASLAPASHEGCEGVVLDGAVYLVRAADGVPLRVDREGVTRKPLAIAADPHWTANEWLHAFGEMQRQPQSEGLDDLMCAPGRVGLRYVLEWYLASKHASSRKYDEHWLLATLCAYVDCEFHNLPWGKSTSGAPTSRVPPEGQSGRIWSDDELDALLKSRVMPRIRRTVTVLCRRAGWSEAEAETLERATTYAYRWVLFPRVHRGSSRSK